jgi:hypothetical protein
VRADDEDERATAPMKVGPAGALVAEVRGFNRHTAVRVEADERDALERLCRYMARPAVAAGRVSVLPDGNVAYRVRSPRGGAATHRLMTPMEFMARLSALVAPPRTPLVRHHGVLAPNSRWRAAVVPSPPIEEGSGACGGGATMVVAASATMVVAAGSVASTAAAQPTTAPSAAKAMRINGATLFWRGWGVDALPCPGCGARMKMIAALTERAAIVRILEHIGESTEAPRMRRARDGP